MLSKKRYLNNFLLLLIFACCALMSSLLLFNTHDLFGAGDMQFHLKRLAELEVSCRHINILPLFSFNQFHGSAVFTLYPYLNLLPLAFMSIFIKSNIVLIYVFFCLNVFLSLILSYYSSLKLSRSEGTSLLFSIVYSLSTPFIAYGFYNMDLGALTSIAVFPLVIFGFFNLVQNNKWLELSIGMILLIYTHVLSTCIVLGVLLLLLFINSISNYKKIINKRFWDGIFKAILLSVLLTSIVWIPALVFSLNNFGNVFPPALINMSKIYFKDLINYGIHGYITYNLGIISLIGVILPIIYKIYREFINDKHELFNIYTKQMYGIALFVIFTCRFFPWNISNHGILKIFMVFQFTWRFYIIPELFLSYVFSVCVVKCLRHNLIRRLFITVFIVIAIVFQILGQERLVHESINAPSFTSKYVISRTSSQIITLHHRDVSVKQFHFIYYKNPRYPYYKITNKSQLNRLINTNTDENAPDYYPIKSLPKVNYVNNNKATYSRNRMINVKHTGYNRFSFNSPKRINRLALPLLHYNGEYLRVYVNNHLVHYHTNDSSLITLSNVHKGEHQIKIKYIPNVWLVALKAVMFFSGILWLLLICYKKMIRSHKAQKLS